MAKPSAEAAGLQELRDQKDALELHVQVLEEIYE
jgi:hypothetical protein